MMNKKDILELLAEVDPDTKLEFMVGGNESYKPTFVEITNIVTSSIAESPDAPDIACIHLEGDVEVIAEGYRKLGTRCFYMYQNRIVEGQVIQVNQNTKASIWDATRLNEPFKPSNIQTTYSYMMSVNGVGYGDPEKKIPVEAGDLFDSKEALLKTL